MENLAAGDLTVEAVTPTAGGPIQLLWQGKSNDRHPGKILGPFFASVLGVAAEERTAIEMHFEKLEHFNSSTITAVIQVIQDARKRGVKLVFVYDQGLKWQKLSFDALRIFEKPDGMLTFRPL